MAADPTGDNDVVPTVVSARIYDPRMLGPVLERLVSAGAARADLTIEQMMSAVTAVDALVDAAARHASGAVSVALEIGPRRLRLTLPELDAGQAARIIRSTELPGVGDVLGRLTAGFEIVNGDEGESLTVHLA